MTDDLKIEIEFFEQRRSEWVAHHVGKFALIRGNELAGFFDSAEAAFKSGVGKWGNVPFLVKRVLPQDPIESAPALACGLLNASI